ALRLVRRNDPRRLRRLLLLVPADVAPDVLRTPRPLAFRLNPNRHEPRLLHDALPRPRGDAPARVRLPALHVDVELARNGRGVHPGDRSAHLRGECGLDVPRGPGLRPGSLGRASGTAAGAARARVANLPNPV